MSTPSFSLNNKSFLLFLLVFCKALESMWCTLPQVSSWNTMIDSELNGLFAHPICFKLVNTEKKPQRNFTLSLLSISACWYGVYIALLMRGCSEVRSVPFYVLGGLCKQCHANYVVYLKPKILMDSRLRVPVEEYWQDFLPIMTFLFSSVFIFQSTFFRVTSFKRLLFIVRTFSPPVTERRV